jgi:predicted alpha/beta superfamily hydrolase
MKIVLINLFFILSFTSLYGQTKSEYYSEGTDTIIFSKFLNENKKITINLPKTYNTYRDSKFPIILIFDRQNNKNYRQIFEIINYLVSFDEIPESIIIGISSDNHSNRYLETSLTISNINAKGENFERFIFEELIPWTEKEYNASKIRTIIGHSRFAYLSTYFLTKRIHEISAVVAISPFYTQKNVNIVDSLKVKLLNTKLNNKVYYRFITGDPITDSKDYDIMNEYLTKNEIGSNFNWKGYTFNNVQHMAVPGLALPPSLIDIFDVWSEKITEIQRSKISLSKQKYSEFKNEIKAHYGYEIGIGLAVLNGIANSYYNEAKYIDAIVVWEILLKDYPMFTYSNIDISKAYLKLNDNVNAKKFLNQAKLELVQNKFYSIEEKQNIENEINKIQNGI